MSTPHNGMNVIDSRDVIARIAELESEREDLVSAIADAKETYADATDDTSALGEEEKEELQDAVKGTEEALADWDADNAEELKALKDLDEEASGCAEDWKHGATLIADSYFEEYAEQFAEDIGAIKSDASWPNDCIDWAKAAEALQMDYTSVDFNGVTYWVR